MSDTGSVLDSVSGRMLARAGLQVQQGPNKGRGSGSARPSAAAGTQKQKYSVSHEESPESIQDYFIRLGSVTLFDQEAEYPPQFKNNLQLIDNRLSLPVMLKLVLCFLPQ